LVSLGDAGPGAGGLEIQPCAKTYFSLRPANLSVSRGNFAPIEVETRLTFLSTETRVSCFAGYTVMTASANVGRSISGFGDEDWEDLLDAIANGRIIPVLGEQAVTFRSPNDSPDVPLYKALPTALAQKLSIPIADNATFTLTVSDVARSYLLQQGVDRNLLYSRLQRLVDQPRQPGTVLHQLASIDGFDLYLSATCDSLLETALTQARPGTQQPKVVAYHPRSATKDVGNELMNEARGSAATVFHLLGRASPSRGEYVVWEDDLLDFVLALAHDFQSDSTRRLRDYLAQRSLLAIGLELSDWILLLVLRLARQRPFLEEVDNHKAWLAEPSAMGRHRTVFMIGGMRGGVRPIDSSVEAFVAELYRRWSARPRQPSAVNPPRPSVSADAPFVFISYAREDENAARNITQALESRVPVFFDRTGLRAAMNYEREIEKKIKDAAVFVSIVSRNTEKGGGDFFKLERNWAAERGRWFADVDRSEFYVPLIIDDTMPAQVTYEPDIFSKCQWTHCPGGSLVNAPDLVDVIARICEKRHG